MRGVLVAAASCLLVAGCAPTEPTTVVSAPGGGEGAAPSSSDEEVVAEAFRDCVRTFPNMTAFRSTLNRGGIRAEGAVPDLFVHTANRRDVLIVSNTRGGDPRCGFGIKGVRTDAAIAFADAQVRRTLGPGASRISMENRQGVAGWRGSAGGEPVLVVVTRDFFINPFFRGALIVITRDD